MIRTVTLHVRRSRLASLTITIDEHSDPETWLRRNTFADHMERCYNLLSDPFSITTLNSRYHDACTLHIPQGEYEITQAECENIRVKLLSLAGEGIAAEELVMIRYKFPSNTEYSKRELQLVFINPKDLIHFLTSENQTLRQYGAHFHTYKQLKLVPNV